MTKADRGKGVREQRRRETRSRILEAAREAFVEKGFDKGTMRDIAARAGVGLGSVNLHFGDKTSLMHAVFYDEIERKSFSALNAVPDASLATQLRFLLEREYAFYGQGGAVFAYVVKESFFAGGSWGERYEEQAERYVAALAGLFDTAARRGEIRRGTDCRVAAMACFSHYVFGLVLGLQREPFDKEKAIQTAQPMILHLVDALRLEPGHKEEEHGT